MKTLKKNIVAVGLLLVFLFAPTFCFAAGEINLNTASVAELTQLPRIGEKIAEKIVEYRTLHEFTSIDELVNVDGIGEKTLANLRDLITVEDDQQ
jgi:competence protein ComEA